jgi:citrate synthase
MSDKELISNLSTFDQNGATIRGKNLVRDLIGEVSFSKMIYFYILGKMPTPEELSIVDAVLVTLMDHGMSGGLSARMIYRSSPDSLQGAVAAGLLGMGSQFGGVMEQVGQYLDEIVKATDQDAKAREIVTQHRSRKKALPGFGHNDFKPDDPRTPKLLAVAKSANVKGDYIKALLLMSKVVDEIVGKHLTINATAAIAAVLAEIGVPFKIMRGFSLISRAPGLVGQILEEQTNPIAGELMQLVNDKVVYKGETA